LQQIAEIVQEREFGPDELIFAEKTEAHHFYIIVRGKVEISKLFEDGERAVLCILSDGAFFGEIALLDEGKRSSTVTAIEPTLVLMISKADFEGLLFSAPVLTHHIMRELGSRLRETDALLISHLTHRNKQLYRAYIDTMTLIIDTIESRNMLPARQSARVTALALELGRQLGLGEMDLFLLELSALLHDLGMYTIPDETLNAKSVLSDDELSTIQAHSTESANMVSSIPMLQKIIPLIRHHHEWYNGGGYPGKIGGRAIPRVSRILAIADAYVSMTGNRPYRDKMSRNEALDEIRRLSGSQFDPEFSEVFLKMMGTNILDPLSGIDELQKKFTEKEMNLADYLLVNGKDGDIAVIDGDHRVTYAELRDKAGLIAAQLSERGLKPGDAVGILGQNSVFWVASYLAVLKLSLIAVPFSILLTPEEISRNAEWAKCKGVLMDRRQQKKFDGAFPPALPRLLDDILDGPGKPLWPHASSSFDTQAAAAYMFTSGTTSRPKAVRITHANIQSNTASIIEYLSLAKSDRMLVILPFFYCFGTSLLHTHLRVGGSVVICNSFTFPEMALDLMQREECTGFAGVPSSYQLLLRISTFKTREFPKLRLLQQAGGKLHSVLLEELMESKPNVRIFVMYGQTEATARLSYLPPEMLRDKIGSIGRGIPGVTLRVMGENGEPVKPGAIGEIYARGGNISPGYLNDPESTAAKFVDGELHTGDLAMQDEQGYIFVVDRKEDFIKSWGYRVSSQEVESCVLGLPNVVSAAAVGIPDLSAGESIHVFITVKPGTAVNEETVIARCRSRLGKHMIPQKVHVIKAMPLNSNGKVMKTALRQMANDAGEG